MKIHSFEEIVLRIELIGNMLFLNIM